MNAGEVLRIVDAIHRDKNIDKEIVFTAIEQALITGAKKHFGEEEDVLVTIDRETGEIGGTHNDEPLHEDQIGRIGAQTAKQVIIQKIREAERDSLHDEYTELIGQMVTGIVQRYERGAATVQLPSGHESILPRSEQIPGETHHANERVRATVFEVRKQGSRVKIILSRIRAHLVQRLFEQEIPEIAEGVIAIRAMAREPGYRSKVAVSSFDQRVDCVGACVGVRGNRIKNIVDELAGERIDIVRWDDDLQVLIPNALQPAEVDDVILCQMLGRAIVLVREDQLSLAIGRRGQNVRLASKLSGWDIEIMTQEELGEQIDRAVAGFSELNGLEEELAVNLVEQGFMSYDDLSIIEPDALMEMGSLSEEAVDKIVEQAEARAEEAEKLATDARRKRKEQDRIDAAAAAVEATAAAARAAAGEDAEVAEAESAAEATEGTDTAEAAEATSEETAPEEAPKEVAEETSAESDDTSSAGESGDEVKESSDASAVSEETKTS